MQKNSVPSHTARNTISYLLSENITSVEPEIWPVTTKQFGLEPIDIAVWGSLKQRVYCYRQFETMEQLKQAIVDEWRALSHKFTDRIINEWRRRMECVVQQNGRHIKHFLEQLFSSKPTLHFCYSFLLHVCILLLSFIDLLCELYVYTTVQLNWACVISDYSA